jgi:hypothetical protein
VKSTQHKAPPYSVFSPNSAKTHKTGTLPGNPGRVESLILTFIYYWEKHVKTPNYLKQMFGNVSKSILLGKAKPKTELS